MTGLTTIDAMKQAVDENGGKMSETDYLEAVKTLIEDSGRTTSIDSLKVNAFNKGRMTKAGITRVTVGSDKMVWQSDKIQNALNGVTTNVSDTVVEAAKKLVEMQPTINTPKFVKKATTGGSFYGIQREDPTQYDELLQSMIPTPVGFVESKRNEFRLLALLRQRSLAGDTVNSHMLAEGPTGCGKSQMAKDFCGQLNTPLARVNMSDGVTEDAFIGTRTIDENGRVVYQDGILTFSMENGIPLLVDEINAGRENCLIALNMALDSGILVIPEDNNRVVKAKAGFMVIGTMNPPEDYAGVNSMNYATKNRFTFNLEFDYLPHDLEVKVVSEQANFKDKETISQIVTVANDLRRMKKEGVLESDTSTRSLIQLFNVMHHLTMKEAIEYVLLGRYMADEREHIEATFRARLEDY